MTSNQVENKTEMTSNQVENCPVCYAELTVKNVMNMRCSHQLCKDCFYNWVDETGKNSCPCCRDEIMKSENFMMEEKLKAKAYCDRMEFAAEVWREKRDKKRKEYCEASADTRVEEERYRKMKKQRREETYETARLLTLQSKYHSKINKMAMRVSLSLSPYECRAYYQKKIDKNCDNAEKKARGCFKEVLKEMKEVFGCYMSGKGRSSFCEDILMLIDGLKFQRELEKEEREGEHIYFADMFDNEEEGDEDKMKILKEYDDYCDKMKKKEKIYTDRRRESVGMLMEDDREEEVVYREFDWDYQIEKKRRVEEIDVMKFDKIYHKKYKNHIGGCGHWSVGVLEWRNTAWKHTRPRGEDYIYTEQRNGKKVCIKGTKEIQYSKSLLPPINRGLYDRLTRKRMEAYKNENYEDLNLSDMFNEPPEFTGEETRDSIALNNRIASWTDGFPSSRHRWNLGLCLDRIQNGEINYSSAYNYAVDSDSDTDSSMPELEEVEHVEPEHAIAMSRPQGFHVIRTYTTEEAAHRATRRNYLSYRGSSSSDVAVIPNVEMLFNESRLV